MVIQVAVALLGTAACTDSAEGPAVRTIAAEDGVRISYASDGRGDAAIVFIHGWTCDHTHWRFQVPEFRKSHRVITIDLPGHGKSGSDRNSWTIDGLGADVAVVVLSLDLKRVVLVGHSMGGFVALAAAPRLRGIVRGVVAMDSLQNAEFKAPAETIDRIVGRFEEDFEGARTNFVSSFFEDKESMVLKWILASPDVTDRRAAVALLRDYNEFDLKSAMAAAGVPLRAINAADGFPTAVEINRKYGDFDAVLMPRVGHFPMMENAADFNRHLRTVIENLHSR